MQLQVVGGASTDSGLLWLAWSAMDPKPQAPRLHVVRLSPTRGRADRDCAVIRVGAEDCERPTQWYIDSVAGGTVATAYSVVHSDNAKSGKVPKTHSLRSCIHWTIERS